MPYSEFEKSKCYNFGYSFEILQKFKNNIFKLSKNRFQDHTKTFLYIFLYSHLRLLEKINTALILSIKYRFFFVLA